VLPPSLETKTASLNVGAGPGNVQVGLLMLIISAASKTVVPETASGWAPMYWVKLQPGPNSGTLLA